MCMKKEYNVMKQEYCVFLGRRKSFGFIIGRNKPQTDFCDHFASGCR